MEYVLIRKKGQKTVRLTINKDGDAVVTCGTYVSEKSIAEFVASKAKWIEKHRNIVKARWSYRQEHAYRIGGKFAFMGEDLDIAASDNGRVYIADGKLYLPTDCDVPATLAAYEKYLAKERLTRMYAEETERLGIKKSPALVLKSLKSKWGHYNRDKHTVMLNVSLIRAKESCARAVICHELTHIEHFDHSKAFYAALGKAYPEYKSAIKELDRIAIDK